MPAPSASPSASAQQLSLLDPTTDTDTDAASVATCAAPSPPRRSRRREPSAGLVMRHVQSCCGESGHWAPEEVAAEAEVPAATVRALASGEAPAQLPREWRRRLLRVDACAPLADLMLPAGPLLEWAERRTPREIAARSGASQHAVRRLLQRARRRGTVSAGAAESTLAAHLDAVYGPDWDESAVRTGRAADHRNADAADEGGMVAAV